MHFFPFQQTLTASLWNQETVMWVLLLFSFLHFLPSSVAPNLKYHWPLIPEVIQVVFSWRELKADFYLNELIHSWIWLFIFYSTRDSHGAICQQWSGCSSQIRQQPASSLTWSDSLCRAQVLCIGLDVQNRTLQGLLSVVAQEAENLPDRLVFLAHCCVLFCKMIQNVCFLA